MEEKGASTVRRFESSRGKWEKPLIAPWKGWGVEVGVGVEVSYYFRRKFPIQVLNQKCVIAVSSPCLKLCISIFLYNFCFLFSFPVLHENISY